MSLRQRLPNRRPNISTTLILPGWPTITATVGLDADGRVRELFLRAIKPDSQLDRLLDDCAVLASYAMQLGCAAGALAHAVATNRHDQPATLIGAAMLFAATIDAEGTP